MKKAPYLLLWIVIDQWHFNTVTDTILTGCFLHNICILNDEEILQTLEELIPQCALKVYNYLGQEHAAQRRVALNISSKIS